MQGIPLFSTVNLLINHEQPEDYRGEDMSTTAIDDPNLLQPQTKPEQQSNIEPDNDENLIDSDLNSENSQPEQDDEQQQQTETDSNSNSKKQQRRKLLNTSKLDTCTIQVYPALNPGKLILININ